MRRKKDLAWTRHTGCKNWNRAIGFLQDVKLFPIIELAQLLSELSGIDIEPFPTQEQLRHDSPGRDKMFTQEELRKYLEMEGAFELDIDALIERSIKPGGVVFFVMSPVPNQPGIIGHEFHVFELPPDASERWRKSFKEFTQAAFSFGETAEWQIN